MAQRLSGEWTARAVGTIVALAGTAALVAGAAACSRRAAAPARVETAGGAAMPRQELPPAQALEQAKRLAAPGPAAPAPAGETSGIAAMAAARKLVRTGRLSLEVASYAAASEQAVRLAEGCKGYLADSQSARSEHGRLRGSLTLRVPAGEFSSLFAALKALGAVQSESVSAQDVTKAYTDLETRLRVKRETAGRLHEILATRTAKLSDVLEAERELARVTEEIETLEGERRYYDQQVALSTITAEIAEPEPLVRSGFLDPIRGALAQSLELLGGSLAALLALVVVATPWALALLLLWWLVRRLRTRATRA
jgi:hypothetical protein